MINYAKHDEEFYGIFKLNNGEEVVGKAVLTDDQGETLVFISNPVVIETYTRELDSGKISRGMGFSHWMQMSDEEFFILREKDIIALGTLQPEYVIMYEAYIRGDEIEKKTGKKEVALDPNMGHLGNINKTRSLLEKLFKGPSHFN
ncbi:gp143 [Synechococcus phage syn9]|uniref:Gp143 n=1 Tax=Synechococcus phage syn9 TaxID=382359 RepID=Q0QZ83_BPSYS|nr:methylamine utilization [Synechococcus phage syn9]ABA47113.1 gp143 [Synechococcus phage syn9]AGH56531.1 hypothetical protein CPUG_00039 [Cyanophage Syn10]